MLLGFLFLFLDYLSLWLTSLTVFDLNLCWQKLLESGEDTTVGDNNRCMDLDFPLTFPHFHTFTTEKSSSSQADITLQLKGNLFFLFCFYHTLLLSHWPGSVRPGLWPDSCLHISELSEWCERRFHWRPP